MLHKKKILAVVVLLGLVTLLATSCCYPCFSPCYPCQPCPPSANPSIDIVKYVQVDPAANPVTWHDANIAPFPTAYYCVRFKFEVTNTGDVDLNNVTIIDKNLLLTIPVGSLAPGQTYVSPPTTTTHVEGLGLHTNTATAEGEYNGTIYQDTDKANFFRAEPSP